MTIPQAKSHSSGDVKVTYTPLFQGGIQVRATRNGDTFHAAVHTFETDAQRDYQRLADLYPIGAEGDQITCQAGSHTVALIVARDGWRVETANTGGLVDAWTRTMTSLDETRTAARRAVQAFRAHGTADAISAERKRLTFANLKALNDRASTSRLAAIDAQIIAVTDFDTETELAALAAA